MDGIAKWIDKRASITPERIALIGDYRQLSYLDMSIEVTRLARMLAVKYRLRQGDRVGIMAMNGIDYVLLLFAIAKLGCIAVVLNIRLTARELEFQANDSGIKLLVAEECFLEVVERFVDDTGIERVLWFESHPSSPIALQHLAAAYSSAHAEPDSVSGSNDFIICYTSGTTGRPKGAVLTQENMFWNAVNNCLALDLTSADRILTVLPMFHIGGIGLFAFPALFAGGTVVIPNRFDPEKMLRLIEDHQVSIMFGVPTMFDLLRKSPGFATADLRSIRWLYCGGAACPHELIAFYWERGIPFAQGFGMTETSPTVFMTAKEDYQRKLGTVGKPVMFCDVRIVDEWRKDVPAGEVGELLVQGPNVLTKYWNLPEATAASTRDGWFETGDLAKRDEEGFFYIVGRKKDMIISGGENIYPLEVEQVIYELPAVDEAAVVGIPNDKWGESPIAVIVPKAGFEIDEAAVRAHCRRRLAKYKVPASVIFASGLPKNATGKIDKKAIRLQYAECLEGERTHG